MKKLFFCSLAIVAIIVSCSKDTDEIKVNDTTSFNEKSLTNLESLYLTMISSDEYIAYKEVRDEFVAKMNFNGNFEDLNSEAAIKEWIRINISITDFADVTSANNEYDTVKERSLAYLLANKDFFEELQLVGGDDLPGIIEGPGQEVPQSCPECEQAFNDCTDGMKAWKANAQAEASLSWVSPDINSTNEFNTALSVINIQYQNGMENCGIEMLNCCYN